LRSLPMLPNHSPPPKPRVPTDQGADDRNIKAGYPSRRPMDEVSFRNRLSGILGDPVLSLGVLDPRTEEPYLELCELFMECNENQRARIRAGWPYEREWRIPVPGTTHDWRGGEVTVRRVRACLVFNAILPAVSDSRDILVGFPVIYWAANQLGMNADALFKEVAIAASPEVSDLITKWMASSERQSPEDGGWRLVDSPDGPRYKLSW
jgi:hypothetical protein